jgi:hypothetical protein
MLDAINELLGTREAEPKRYDARFYGLWDNAPTPSVIHGLQSG